MLSNEANRVAFLVSWLLENSQGADTEQLPKYLDELKTLSRIKENAASLNTDSGISLLSRLSLAPSSQNKIWSKDAKRCLANAMTLDNVNVSHFNSSGGLSLIFNQGMVDILTQCSAEDEFLLARIMFLYTAKSGSVIKDELERHQKLLLLVLNSWYRRYQDLLNNAGLTEDSANIAAFSETLKFSYNVSLLASEVWNSVDMPIFTFIQKLQKSHGPLKLCILHCVNLLINSSQNYSEDSVTIILELFSELVTCIVRDTTWAGNIINADQLQPMLKVLSDMFSASAEDSSMRKLILSHLIVADRSLPLGQADSIPSYLLRILNTTTPENKECICALLYQVSGSNPTKLVENIGYGFAIGFLTAHHLPIPPDQLPSSHNGKAINPVTGQTLSDEATQTANKELAEMTDEEKEREAEKLFVLFQRLKKTGVIDVQDPIQQAVDSGRFQEM